MFVMCHHNLTISKLSSQPFLVHYFGVHTFVYTLYPKKLVINTSIYCIVESFDDIIVEAIFFILYFNPWSISIGSSWSFFDLKSLSETIRVRVADNKNFMRRFVINQ